MSGKVYLVGAGPGDPGLLTVKGVECLRRADVLIYDRLASPALLDYAPAQAERIYVGKSSGDHTLPQSEVNDLLIQRARAGKSVVRLKGGDPFVFGRGGEEARALADAGVPFEMVPGVSSAVAVPAYAGIPVTHRGLASSFAVITGHRERSSSLFTLQSPSLGGSPPSTLHSPLPSADTLVFLMGVENLENVVASLLELGHAPETPVALIRWGTTPRQQTVVGTLGDIVERGREIKSPAVLVVGQVVTLRERLCWFEQRPLLGKRILVTRAREQAGKLVSLLAEQGAAPIEFPTIRIEPLQDPALLDRALADRYDWIVFTSVNGVKAVWERLRTAGRDARALSGARLCAIGPATADELASHGLCADYVPAQYVAEAIVAGIGPLTGQRVLLPRADMARLALAQGLRQQGAVVDEVVAYCTVTLGAQSPQAQEIHALLQNGRIDAMTFTSSSTVRGFVEALNLTSDLQSLFSVVPVVACIGPITAQTARELGLPVDVVAQEYTVDGLVAALVAHYEVK